MEWGLLLILGYLIGAPIVIGYTFIGGYLKHKKAKKGYHKILKGVQSEEVEL